MSSDGDSVIVGVLSEIGFSFVVLLGWAAWDGNRGSRRISLFEGGRGK